MNAKEMAAIIMNGKKRIKTEWGEKTAAGLEAMIIEANRESLTKCENALSLALTEIRSVSSGE